MTFEPQPAALSLLNDLAALRAAPKGLGTEALKAKIMRILEEVTRPVLFHQIVTEKQVTIKPYIQVIECIKLGLLPENCFPVRLAIPNIILPYNTPENPPKQPNLFETPMGDMLRYNSYLPYCEAAIADKYTMVRDHLEKLELQLVEEWLSDRPAVLKLGHQKFVRVLELQKQFKQLVQSAVRSYIHAEAQRQNVRSQKG